MLRLVGAGMFARKPIHRFRRNAVTKAVCEITASRQPSSTSCFLGNKDGALFAQKGRRNLLSIIAMRQGGSEDFSASPVTVRSPL